MSTTSAEQCSLNAIKARINRIVQRRQSRQRCRLSDEELVLLALAYSPDEWLETAQIGEFAISSNRFFQKQAAQILFGKTSFYASSQGIGGLPGRIESYLRTYGIPVHSKIDENNRKVFSMTAGAAYALLEGSYRKRSKVTDKKLTTCPLLKTPVEIRMRIYHLVLKVSGFRLLVGNRSFSVYDDKIPIWESRSQNALTMPPLNDFLALLSVNKQIYNEAMPEFYHENHFQFRDMGSMKNFLHNIGPERRKHMRNVSVYYDNLSAAAAGARLLAESDTLQRLTLTISAAQDPAGHFTVNSSRRRFSSLTQIPGFTSMKRLRNVQQLTFNPRLEHDVIDAFLRPIVTMPKSGKVVKRKRKHVELVSDHETGQPSPKVSKIG
ncbi:hypothetical protein QM012_001059 [Aureobasidium pullulans]|uniref:DUF7730 domain-containing protein n=1 Tax=Aureobasidium pullulans TaxID=5580 RepID=A0ABR0TFJ7_AURPU